MALPKAQKGRPILAADVAKITQAAARGAGLKVNRGLETGGGEDLAVAVMPSITPQPNCIRAKYTSPQTAPRFGLVKIHDGLQTGDGPIIAEVRRPDQGGWKNVGILLEGAAQNQVVWVQRQGPQFVIFDYDTVPERLQGEARYRLGTGKNTHLAVYQSIGPLYLIADLGEYETDYEETVHLGVVAVNTERDQSIFLVNSDESIAQGFEALWVGDEYVLHEDGELPGIVRVEYA